MAVLRRILTLAALPTLAICGRAYAQTASPPDTIHGRVTSDSIPVPHARVQLTTEHGSTSEAVTDTAGRYRFVIPNDGMYELRIRAFGFTPLYVIVKHATQPDAASHNIQRDVRLDAIPISLARVDVLASPATRNFETPADRSARWQSFLSESQPVDPGDIGAVAALLPGITSTGRGNGAVSVYGQSPEQNSTVIDGATSSNATLPAEGVRSVGVVANTYDVSRGQFSGGQLSATTISGTNEWGGAIDARIDAPWLDYGALPGSTYDGTGQLRLSGGGGGAVVRDRFFTYSAIDVVRTSYPRRGGIPSWDDTTLRRLGASPDSVRRFEAVAGTLGFPNQPTTNGEPASSASSGMTRTDITISDHASLMVRLDARDSHADNAESSPLSLIQSGGVSHSQDAGVLANLSYATPTWSNELRLHRSSGTLRSSTRQQLPSAQVNVVSSDADGPLQFFTLSVANQDFASRERHSLLELADDVTRSFRNGSHSLHAGIVGQLNNITSQHGYDRNGSFVFSNLGDFASNRPSLYTRTLTDTRGTASQQYGAAFLSDQWHPATTLSLIYGLRLDGTHYGRHPTPAANVAALSTAASSRIPTELALSPRIGIDYNIPSSGSWTVRAGAGRFVGMTPLSSLAQFQAQTGTNAATLTCIGQAAPVPAWSNYAIKPAAIPTLCADESAAFSGNVPSAAVFSTGFRSPETLRTSLGIGGNVSPRIGVSVDALLLHGIHYVDAIDRNLVATPQFALRSEADRPMYAAPDQIDPATGAIAPAASRVDASLGPVLELDSRGQNWSTALTARVGGFIPGGTASLSYTYLHSRMLQNGAPSPDSYSISTGGDPRTLEWTDSPFAPRHSILLMLSRGFARRVRVTAVGRLTSGLPFTPLVESDINGDGFANDRAFIFDPRTATDPTVVRSMELLRKTSSPSVRDCLTRQAGRIAAPGSCSTPWSPSLDLRAQIYALGDINSRRLMINVTASNVTAGLDYLMHGPDNLRGWGQYPDADATLLRVRSYDPVGGTFGYIVNSHFGRRSALGAQRVPFRLTLEGRIALGSDPRYQPLMNAIAAGVAASPQGARAWLQQYVHNIPDAVLQLAATDSTVLALTSSQRVRLRSSADSLRVQFAAGVDSLTRVLTEQGSMTAARQVRLQHASEHIELLVKAALDATRTILMPSQFEKLPEWLLRPPTTIRLQNPVYTTEVGSGEP